MANSCCFALYCVNPLLWLDFIVIFVVKKGVSMLLGGYPSLVCMRMIYPKIQLDEKVFLFFD